MFQEAVTAIESWKVHQLRVVNQDKARSDVTDCLSETNVLLIQDWAMNFAHGCTASLRENGLEKGAFPGILQSL